jgi:PAS domain S-box-containing protein
MNARSDEPSGGEPSEVRAEPSDAAFRLFVDAVGDYAIFMLDPGGQVLTWNEGARRIKGYEAEEIVGSHFSRFYTQEAIDAKHPDRELALAAADGRYEEEGWRVRKDGSQFYANVVITAVYDDEGRLRGFGKVTRDITERKQAEERLAEAKAEGERLRLRRQHALEINDNLVQGLALAKYRLALGDVAGGLQAISDTLEEARRIVGDLHVETGPTKPGDLRRGRFDEGEAGSAQ